MAPAGRQPWAGSLCTPRRRFQHAAAPILVSGATGKTGRRIAARLQLQGHAVHPGARGAAIPFDWDQPATWPAALQRVRSAAAADLQHLVLLSGRNACLADGVQQALGRAPRDFADFCRTAAAAGVWAAV